MNPRVNAREAPTRGHRETWPRSCNVLNHTRRRRATNAFATASRAARRLFLATRRRARDDVSPPVDALATTSHRPSRVVRVPAEDERA